MEYTYTIYTESADGGPALRGEITTDVHQLKPTDVLAPRYVSACNELTKQTRILATLDDLEEHISSRERAAAWKPKVVEKDHINPTHYQAYIKTEIEELQWLEAMQYLPHYRDPKAFLAAVELQVRKYLDRSGGKDEELQETKKAMWYLRFMTAYMANGYKPIRVKDIDKLLGKI